LFKLDVILNNSETFRRRRRRRRRRRFVVPKPGATLLPLEKMYYSYWSPYVVTWFLFCPYGNPDSHPIS
jgi:hypothetical protein